jgi:hypothetical protein
MKLRRHRTDVKDLRLMQDNYVQEIAGRYQRLYLFAEEVAPWLTPELWKTLQRVLKDAEK